MYKFLLLVWLLMGCAFMASAQNADTTSKNKIKVKAKDTIISTKHDTAAARAFKPKKLKTYHPDSTHNPHLAVMHSLMVPGWGQVYNHQVWKVPVIYAALGALGYYIVWNNNNYKEFLALSVFRLHGTVPGPTDPNFKNYNLYQNVPLQALNDQTDYFRRNRDLCILGVLGTWGINLVDAYVNAKFIHSYTVDENFSFRITPDMIAPPSLYAANPISSYIPGIKITFTLK
jgi:hypothetical protein